LIIDGHAHSAGDFFDADKMIEIMDSLGVDKVVLCPGVVNDPKNQSLVRLSKFKNPDHMIRINRIIRFISNISRTKETTHERNEYVHLQCLKFPDRIIHFYWVDPFQKDLLQELEREYDNFQFKGLKLHQCFQHFKNDMVMLAPVLEFARRKEIPIFIHVSSKREVKNLIDIIKNNTDIEFIIGHLIGLEFYIENCSELENIYFDISPTPLISPERIMKAIKVFGADHVIMGSDTPYGKNNLSDNIGKVKRLKITEEEKALILGENMRNLLSL
jgi:predicted TIM-barrel fold metal-dependent hydrolase